MEIVNTIKIIQQCLISPFKPILELNFLLYAPLRIPVIMSIIIVVKNVNI